MDKRKLRKAIWLKNGSFEMTESWVRDLEEAVLIYCFYAADEAEATLFYSGFVEGYRSAKTAVCMALGIRGN